MTDKWTDEQENAINARGGTLLVSAAAGSGKTAVLVERIIKRITDRENPCNIDELLVVTFTKPAAAEMRERIMKRIGELLAENPYDLRLARQQFLLPYAKICTIDSFCGELVRESASSVGVSENYSVVSGAQYDFYRHSAVKKALSEMYCSGSEGFNSLVELVSSGRDDSALEETVLSVHEFINAYPFPDEALKKMGDMYFDAADVQDTPWGKTVLRYGVDVLEHLVSRYDLLIEVQRENIELFEKYLAFTVEHREEISGLLQVFKSGDWDTARNALLNMSFGKLPILRGVGEHPVKIFTGEVRKDEKDAIAKISDAMPAWNSEFIEDRKICAPIVEALVKTVSLFSEKLSEMMAADGVMSFSDVLHTAINILTEKKDGKILKTQAAVELSQKFTEILVDEYQDINAAQHMMFSALSRDEGNVFMVGDVKQSIYAFRQAMPEIFLGMRDEFYPYSHRKYPAKISLGKNFRSALGVIDCVNFCFKSLMSEDTGGIAYGAEDRLVYGASYGESKAPEFDIIEIGSGVSASKDALQAEHISRLIKKTMTDGSLVTEKDGTKRRPKLSDFCVLLRSAKGHAGTYVSVLKSNGINAVYELTGDFFEFKEISIILSLLRAVDNPLLDVELLSVMMSPLYGFTPDEMAEIRLRGKHIPLYSAVKLGADGGNEKCRHFLDDLSEYRLIAGNVGSDEFLRRVYEKTSIVSIAGAMGCSAQRRANLMLLLDCASSFESTGFRGLSAFTAFVGKLQESGGKFSAADASDSGDCVRVMTVHKSKGLEFPFCIVAGLSTSFKKNSYKKIFVHPRLGFGFNIRDISNLREYKTVQRTAVDIETNNDDMAEQIRTLYVAMTRAKERLIMVACVTNVKKTVVKCFEKYSEKLGRFAVLGKGNEAEMLLECFLKHPDFKSLRLLAGITERHCVKADFPVSVKVISSDELLSENIDTDSEPEPPAAILPETEKEVRRILEYKYPYAALSKVTSKAVASRLDDSSAAMDFFASSAPAFMSEGGLTAAQKGTATHRFLQCCDYFRCYDVEREAKRLLQEGKLTEVQVNVIDRRALDEFFSSELFKRILSSNRIEREYSFAVNVSACEMDKSLPERFKDELVTVQGAVDCFFEENGSIIVVDYKTDRVKSEAELLERYSPQLKMYARAVSECAGKPVSQCLIYSFCLKKCISI